MAILLSVIKENMHIQLKYVAKQVRENEWYGVNESAVNDDLWI